MKPALVSLGAGRSQLPLFAAARRRGLAVIGVDRDVGAAGLGACAAHVEADTHDAEAVLRGLAALEGLRVDGIVAGNPGPPALTAALVADRLGLAGVRADAAHVAVSKSGQRELARYAGLCVPDARTLAPGGAPETPGPPPWVVKPRVTRGGQVAIRRVEHATALAQAVREAAAASEDGCAEVEAWIPGRDVVVAGVFQDSIWTPCATLEEDTRFDADSRVAGWGLAAPAALDAEQARVLAAAAADFVVRNELGTGVLFATFRVPEFGQPTFLQARLAQGGDDVDVLLAELELNELVVDLATRRPVRAPSPGVSRVLRFLFHSDAGERLGRLTAASPTARVVLDRPREAGPRARVGYFVEATEGPAENHRWAERVHELLER
ncbi:MAG: hypothetical protein WD226_00885 [Planctomycetota bacterium]